jgi:VWFA-related protein
LYVQVQTSKMNSPRSTLIFALFLILICSYPSPAQAPQAELIRVTSNLVLVDVRVVNNNTGKAIPGLTADDFEVFEDGVRQEITHFSQDKLPISAVLLLDVSGSMQPVIHELRQDALTALRHLKPEDEVALIAYGGLAQLLQDFTKDRQLVVDRIGWANEFYIGPRGTELAEAVYQAAVYLRNAANPTSRRYVIGVTDDVSAWVGPAHTKKQALDQLLESSASVCGMTVMSAVRRERTRISGFFDPRRVPDWRLLLQDYAGPTGGEVLPAQSGRVGVRLADLFDGIRACYSLGYPPTNPKMNGEFRKIQVRLRHKVLDESTGEEIKPAVVAKSGYYAGRKPAVVVRQHDPDNEPDAGFSYMAESMYYRPSAEEQQMARALFLPAEQKDFRSSLIPSTFLDPHGKSVARISIHIRPDRIRLRKTDDGLYGATFRLRAAVLNQTGMIIDHFGRDCRLAVDEAGYKEFLRTGTDAGMTLALPPGKYRLRTVLRDLGSGKMSTLREPLEVEAFPKGLPAISSVVLSRATVPSGQLAEQDDDYDPLRLGEVTVVPSFSGGYAFEGSLTVFFHIYNVSDGQGVPYQYRLNLYRNKVLVSRGEPRPVKNENRHPMQGYLLAPRLDLSSLTQGEYEVEVEVALPDGSNRISRSESFRVERQSNPPRN